MDDFGKLYSRYKKDTQYVLYYLTTTTNAILRSVSSKTKDDGLTLNMSGQVPVSNLIPMSNLLKQHKRRVPDIIVQLLESVIWHRSQAHRRFLKMTAETPDPEMERSNESHGAFIVILGHVLENLRVLARGSSATADATANAQKEAEENALYNRFNALVIGANGELGESDEESDDPEGATLPGRPMTRTRPKYKKKTGKKNGKGRHQKRQGQSSGCARSSGLDMPLESFRIIEDFRSQGPGGPGLMTDYFLLTRGIFQTMAHLRYELQHLWHQVAYTRLNTAIAGGTSNAAVAVVRKMTLSIFAEFPGNEAYETLWNTITRGDPERIASTFAVDTLLTIPGEGEPVRRKISPEIREQFLYHTYRNLCDFITDWQLNRSGKPTKRMQAELKGWKPDFDLVTATKEERIQWRRVYTINWLYDLVNVYSAVSNERQATRTENAHLARQGKAARQRISFFDGCIKEIDQSWPRLFGLDEFACFITGLVRQDTGSNTKLRLLPEHVFQLQIIVDSFVVSRGWSTSGLKGHVVVPPPADFTPRRDEFSFLDRSEKLNMGYIRSASLLKETFFTDGGRYKDFSRICHQYPLVERVTDHMKDWLGQAKCMLEPSATPPSRFIETTPNGLWEYSPFLCGVGLLECLDMAHAVGTGLMDKCPEVTLLVHLHNKLLCSGYLAEPSCLWEGITEMFCTEFYKNGILPTSNFEKALQSHLGEQVYKSPLWRRSLLRKKPSLNVGRSTINPKTNLFFREKSVVRVLREADWDLDAMLPEEVPIYSTIAFVRMQRANVCEGLPKNKSEEGDQLILRRAAEVGFRVPTTKEVAELPPEETGLRKIHAQSPEQAMGAACERMLAGGTPEYGDQDDPYALLMVKADLENSIVAGDPILGISYLNLVALAIITLLKMEKALQEQTNASWKESRTFKPNDRRFAFDMRYKLLYSALEKDDPECLSTMADVLLDLHYSFEMLTFWDETAVKPDDAPCEHADQSDGSDCPDCLNKESPDAGGEDEHALKCPLPQDEGPHSTSGPSNDERV